MAVKTGSSSGKTITVNRQKQDKQNQNEDKTFVFNHKLCCWNIMINTSSL